MHASKTALKQDVRTAEQDLESARRVLRLEAEGLTLLSHALDASFVQALDIFDGLEGRLVVTGMGKSGHIGCKIVATMASTGTPAQFVHPAEASHGDMGMITRRDAILALSNSGETPELSDMISYSRRFAIPLVAITGKADSSLAQAADVVLLLPEAPEACSMGLAPTTSTTAALALGDALAVALLERKGFTPNDFHTLHPGGKLGKKLLKVGDIMHGEGELPLIDAGKTMAEAVLVMTSKRFGCCGIVDGDGSLKGIVTDGDLRRHMKPELLTLSVADVMTKGPKTIRPTALATEAVQIMNDRAITSLFVVDEGGTRPVGIIHIHDCLRAGAV